jgi:hypothetical protein
VTVKNGVFWDVRPCGARCVRRFLVTANVFPTSPILVILMKEALSSYETSVITRATNSPKDANLHGAVIDCKAKKCVFKLGRSPPPPDVLCFYVVLVTFGFLIIHSVFSTFCMRVFSKFPNMLQHQPTRTLGPALFHYTQRPATSRVVLYAALSGVVLILL